MVRDRQAYQREYYQRLRQHPEFETRERDKKFRQRYGITLADYEERFKNQQGVCAICGREPSDKHPTGAAPRLVVDHDHQSGRVRDLLCRRCNVALGLFAEDVSNLEQAISYLEHWREK